MLSLNRSNFPSVSDYNFNHLRVVRFCLHQIGHVLSKAALKRPNSVINMNVTEGHEKKNYFSHNLIIRSVCKNADERCNDSSHLRTRQDPCLAQNEEQQLYGSRDALWGLILTVEERNSNNRRV